MWSHVVNVITSHTDITAYSLTSRLDHWRISGNLVNNQLLAVPDGYGLLKQHIFKTFSEATEKAVVTILVTTHMNGAAQTSLQEWTEHVKLFCKHAAHMKEQMKTYPRCINAFDLYISLDVIVFGDCKHVNRQLHGSSLYHARLWTKTTNHTVSLAKNTHTVSLPQFWVIIK